MSQLQELLNAISALYFEQQQKITELEAKIDELLNGNRPTPTPTPTSNESPNGASIPPLDVLIDSNNVEWTVKDGLVYANNEAAGYTRGVVKLEYLNKTIRQTNDENKCWDWIDGRWEEVATPVPTPEDEESPNGASIPPLEVLIDSNGAKWTLKDGRVYIGEELAGYSRGVTKLEYLNRTIRQTNDQNKSWDWIEGNWREFSGTTPNPTPTPTSDQPLPTPSLPNDLPRKRLAKVGMGMSQCNYYSTAPIFGDLMEHAQWKDGEWRIFIDVPKAAWPQSGYTVVGSTVQLRIGNGIRWKAPEDAREKGLHVYMPGYAPGQSNGHKRFTDVFLKDIAPFQVLRWMDWLGINHSGIKDWPGDNSSFAIRLEQAIAICNANASDMWMCIPHQATKSCIKKIAKFIKDRLHSSLKVYLEYSNELWNSSFGQWKWAEEESKKNNEHGHDVKARGMRTTFETFAEVFGGTNRLVRVIAGQAANDWHCSQLAQRVGKGNFDAISCATYFAPKNADIPSNANVAKIADMLTKKLNGEVKTWLKEHKKIADDYGVKLVAYEGGQHFTPSGKNYDWYDAYVNIQRSEEMYKLYKRLFEIWNEVGGDMHVLYYDFCRITKWGAWGHKEYAGQPDSETPKYRAILDFN